MLAAILQSKENEPRSRWGREGRIPSSHWVSSYAICISALQFSQVTHFPFLFTSVWFGLLSTMIIALWLNLNPDTRTFDFQPRFLSILQCCFRNRCLCSGFKTHTHKGSSMCLAFLHSLEPIEILTRKREWICEPLYPCVRRHFLDTTNNSLDHRQANVKSLVWK